jgi:DNA-binding LytR/AlgR family response regulator
MLKQIAICDDNDMVCSQIEDYITAYQSNTYCIDIFNSGERLLNSLSMQHYYIIFLDIELPGINGVEVGQYIRNTLHNHQIEIVYISGSNQYDRQLFDVQPLNFISKPITKEAVINTLITAKIRSNDCADNFRYKIGKSVYHIPYSNIIYFQSQNRKIKMETITESIYFYGKIEDIAPDATNHHFLSLNRSELVNLNCISEYHYCSIILTNGEELEVSRANRKHLREYELGKESYD